MPSKKRSAHRRRPDNLVRLVKITGVSAGVFRSASAVNTAETGK